MTMVSTPKKKCLKMEPKNQKVPGPAFRCEKQPKAVENTQQKGGQIQ